MDTRTEFDYIQESLPEMQDYLLSQEIFWPLGGNRPRLTLGGLLLSMRRANALAVSLVDQSTLSQFTTKLESVRTRWRAAWEQKAARELRTRQTLWQNFLGDYRLGPENYADAYSHEVRLRVIIALLLAELPSPAAEALVLLEGLDAQLKGGFVAGAFAWEPALAPGFPESEFWYLYGHLKSR